MSSVRIFLKNRLLVFTYILLFFLINCLQVYGLQFYNQDMLASFSQLRLSLSVSIYYFIFYIFISLEFTFFTRLSVYEDRDYCKKANSKTWIRNFFVLIILNLITTVVFCVYNIMACLTLNINQYELFIHIIISMLLNFFLVGTLAIVMGMCLAVVVKRPIAYIIAILFVFFSSPVFESLEETLLYNYGVNLYPFFKFFNIYSPSLQWMPNFMFGYSILPYRFALISIWIFFFFIILSFKLITKKLIRNLFVSIGVIICSISVGIYFQPSSKLVMNYDPDIGLDVDTWYYSYKDQKEEVGNFDILSYTMDIDISNQLNVVAELEVSKCLPMYNFTLYHGYGIRNICNQDGTNLNFDQDGDYFTVFNNNNNEISKLKIEYSGYSTTFYSNAQGAVLPGFFPYYPRSGFHEVYNLEQMCYNKLCLDYPSDFYINISAGRNSVYSNLNETRKNKFTGSSNGVTIVSGFLKSHTVKGIEIIYPYLDTMSCSDKNIENCVDEFVQKYHDVKKINKIMVLPNLNLGNVSTVVYDDYVTAIGLYDLAEQCAYAEINPNKLYLYQLVEAYMNDIDFFYHISENSENKEIADIIEEKTSKLGINIFLEKFYIYLYDDNDTRSILEFLSSL